MNNNFELITKYSDMAWDVVYKQESMSSLLDTNKDLVHFTGAKTVKIAKFQSGGLHNYYRNNDGDDRVPTAPEDAVSYGSAGFGYQKSNARLTWEEFTLRQDRAAAYPIEMFDNEESGEKLVTLGVKEISRTVIVPEVDAYCFSEIASYCTKELGNLVSLNLAGAETDKPLEELNKAFVYFEEHEVPIEDQLVFVSPKFMNALRNTKEVTKFLGQTDFSNKDIKFTITEYEGRKLVTVTPQRLRTNVILDKEGYSWDKAKSKAINFLMVSKEAVTHVVKYEKVKIIGEDMNLAGNGFDGYTIYARIYHDVFVPDNKRVALYCCVADSEAAPAAKLDVRFTANHKVKSITTVPGDKLYFTMISDSVETVGNTATGTLTPFKVGDEIASAAHLVAVDSNKTVVAKLEAPTYE